MPHIDIKMLPGRNATIKEELALKMQDLAASILSVDKKAISVSVEDVALDEWQEAMLTIDPHTIIIPNKL